MFLCKRENLKTRFAYLYDMFQVLPKTTTHHIANHLQTLQAIQILGDGLC